MSINFERLTVCYLTFRLTAEVCLFLFNVFCICLKIIWFWCHCDTVTLVLLGSGEDWIQKRTGDIWLDGKKDLFREGVLGFQEARKTIRGPGEEVRGSVSGWSRVGACKGMLGDGLLAGSVAGWAGHWFRAERRSRHTYNVWREPIIRHSGPGESRL